MTEERVQDLREELQQELQQRQTELMQEAHPAAAELEQEAHPAEMAAELLEEAHSSEEVLRQELEQLRREKRQRMLLEEAMEVLEAHQVPRGFGEFLVRQELQETRTSAAAFCRQYEQALRKAIAARISQSTPLDFEAANPVLRRRGIVRK